MKITRSLPKFALALGLLAGWWGCTPTMEDPMKTTSAEHILGNPDYPAICYGGFRAKTREIEPTKDQIKEDLRILHAMGIRILRTYNLQFNEVPRLLECIRELHQADPSFEMYVMLGAWIDCKDAWTDHPNHEEEDVENNEAEIGRAIHYAKEYPEIVKVIAVGNEAMVHWAFSYFVRPWVILKYVNQLQHLKSEGELPADLWITSSDNFASWGGASDEYYHPDLTALMHAVDYISVHTYPFHDTHYNNRFWNVHDTVVAGADSIQRIHMAMERAHHYAVGQYNRVKEHMENLEINKPLHIGETGWATKSIGHYGPNGSFAADEYKEALYYRHMREWSDANGVACFYFEAFDEQWKDAQYPGGSENHFGLITLKARAKYALWDLVDQGVFDGLTRDGLPIRKSYDGDTTALMKEVLVPKSVKI